LIVPVPTIWPALLMPKACSSTHPDPADICLLRWGLDNSAAVPEGLLWYDQVSSQKSQACVADAPHPITNVEDGATQIANDIISLCKLQP
jgi:hypothetical protein